MQPLRSLNPAVAPHVLVNHGKVGLVREPIMIEVIPTASAAVFAAEARPSFDVLCVDYEIKVAIARALHAAAP